MTLLITFVLFWGCVCDVVHQPHQPAESKPSIRYATLNNLCAMHFIGVGLRLLQAADSAEVSYTVASMTISIDAKCYCSRLYQVT